MCACRMECGGSTPTSPQGRQFDIDDYYSLAQTMGDREGGESPRTPAEEDVYSQLAQKERDLTLAAELGKALLEKNAELERRNEQLIEEYAKKLEELEQEKYELHLKLEKTQAEYDNTIKELQYDIGQIRFELHSQQHQSSADDKERSNTIKEITLQNERLKEDVQRAAFREEELVSEVQGLREQVTSKRSSMHIHLGQLEVLQEEINLLNERKAELERRIAVISEEKEAISCKMEDSQEKILVLEKQNREKEQQIQNQQRDLIELQETNLQLEAQLHHMVNNHSSRSSGHVLQGELADQENSRTQSIFNELTEVVPAQNASGQSQSLFEELSGAASQKSQKSIGNMMLPDGHDSYSIRPMSLSEMMEEDEYECDDDDGYQGAALRPLNSTMLSDTQFLTHFQNSSNVMDVDSEAVPQQQLFKKLQEELIQTYQQLRQMCHDFSPKYPKGEKSILEEVGLQPGRLSGVLQDLRELMQDMVPRKLMSSAASQANLAQDEDEDIPLAELQRHISELKFELSEAQGDLDRVKTELSERDQQLETKSQELSQLTNKLTMQHDELSKVQAQRDQLQSRPDNGMTRDQVVEQARRDRDEAIEKQNKMEIELAKAKLDLLTLNSQLMETIQQKVALSQQLDQWQVDMEELLDSQMRKRIKEHSEKEQIVDKLTRQIKMRKSKSSSFL